jgi:hypothetical protein
VWKGNVLPKLAKRVKPTAAMLIENINDSWRKTGGTGLPEGSKGIDSSKPETSQISRNHSVQSSLGGGWRSPLWIGITG